MDESITQWIGGMRHGDESSVQRLWERYFTRLVHLADRRLPAHVKRIRDEEDIALSAFNSLYNGVTQGRFPQVDDRQDLWSLLVMITARKANRALRSAATIKRGGREFIGDLAGDNGSSPLEIFAKDPTPEFAAMVAEESERLLKKLPDDSFRHLVTLKMEGHTNDEISQRLGCGKRTVERRLALIRKIWSCSDESQTEL